MGLTGLSHQHSNEADVQPMVIQLWLPVHKACHYSMFPVLQAHYCMCFSIISAMRISIRDLFSCRVTHINIKHLIKINGFAISVNWFVTTNVASSSIFSCSFL